MLNKKLFVVLEGIDSCGKSTQSELLEQYFVSIGEKAILSPEPSTGIIGKLIREALQQKVVFNKDSNLFDRQMAYLFAADRHDHLYNDNNGVFALIERGFNIITTRYYFSSLAYNCETQEQYDLVKRLNHDFPNPDLTIYIDVSVELSLSRLAERSLKEVYENKAKLTKVRDNYQKIFDGYSGNLLTIDGSQSIEDIYQSIIQSIQKNFW